MNGRVVGIHSRIAEDSPFASSITMNMHVPADVFREAWDDLTLNVAYLGIIADLEATECKIAKVGPDSPAAKAGLKENDVIVKFAGQKIALFRELQREVAKQKPGQRIELEVMRGEEAHTLTVTLGRRIDSILPPAPARNGQ
jgi:serine protease Do